MYYSVVGLRKFLGKPHSKHKTLELCCVSYRVNRMICNNCAFGFEMSVGRRNKQLLNSETSLNQYPQHSAEIN